MRQGGAAHHGVSEVLKGRDVRIPGPNAVVSKRKVGQRAVAGKTR